MTTERATTLIAAITSTLYDVGPDDSHPASAVYMALGMDINAYECICHVLRTMGLATTRRETIKLTQAGIDLGRKCSKIYAKAEA